MSPETSSSEDGGGETACGTITVEGDDEGGSNVGTEGWKLLLLFTVLLIAVIIGLVLIAVL